MSLKVSSIVAAAVTESIGIVDLDEYRGSHGGQNAHPWYIQALQLKAALTNILQCLLGTFFRITFDRLCDVVQCTRFIVATHWAHSSSSRFSRNSERSSMHWSRRSVTGLIRAVL